MVIQFEYRDPSPVRPPAFVVRRLVVGMGLRSILMMEASSRYLTRKPPWILVIEVGGISGGSATLDIWLVVVLKASTASSFGSAMRSSLLPGSI